MEKETEDKSSVRLKKFENFFSVQSCFKPHSEISIGF